MPSLDGEARLLMSRKKSKFSKWGREERARSFWKKQQRDGIRKEDGGDRERGEKTKGIFPKIGLPLRIFASDLRKEIFAAWLCADLRGESLHSRYNRDSRERCSRIHVGFPHWFSVSFITLRERGSLSHAILLILESAVHRKRLLCSGLHCGVWKTLDLFLYCVHLWAHVRAKIDIPQWAKELLIVTGKVRFIAFRWKRCCIDAASVYVFFSVVCQKRGTLIDKTKRPWLEKKGGELLSPT